MDSKNWIPSKAAKVAEMFEQTLKKSDHNLNIKLYLKLTWSNFKFEA